MEPQHREHLQKKGWNQAEIARAESILDKPKRHELHFSKIVFWSALVFVIFSNILVSLVLIPLLVALRSWVLYATIALLALVMGSLYTFLITNSGHLEKKHHLAAGILLPLIAFANVVMTVLVSNNFIYDLKAKNAPHSPWISGGIFAGAFILPYVISKVNEMMSGKK